MSLADRLDKNFVDTVIHILKLFYMWSPENENEQVTFYIVVIIFSFIIVPALIILQIIFMIQNISDIDKLVPTLAQCMLQTIYFYKQCIWYYDMRRVKKCFDILERKSFHFYNYEDDNIDFEAAYYLMGSLRSNFSIDDFKSGLHTAKLEQFWMNNQDTVIINHTQHKRRNLKPMKIVYKELMREGNIYCTAFYYGIWIFVFFILFFMCQDGLVQSTRGLYLGKVISNYQLPVNVYLPDHTDDNIIFHAFVAYFVSIAIIILSVQLIGKHPTIHIIHYCLEFSRVLQTILCNKNKNYEVNEITKNKQH